MTSKIGSFFEALSDKSIDETLAVTEMTLAAVTATSYLAATLDATTPEVKRLFNEYTSQHVMSHEVITSFAVKKGWYSPYDAKVFLGFLKNTLIYTKNTEPPPY